MELIRRLGGAPRLAAAILVVSGFVILSSLSDLLGWEFGTVADWVEAIGTAGALLIGAVALRQQVADRHDERERRRLAEARLVTLTEVNRRAEDDDRHVLEVEHHNGTTGFITGVKLSFFPVDSNDAVVFELDHLGPDETAQRDVDLPSEVRHTGVRWFLEWTDEHGVRWRRTNRGQVRRLPTGDAAQ
jgi:hypothetical protein